MGRAAALAACWLFAAAAVAAPDTWAPVRSLVGEWRGEGSARPGEGRGTFSFRFDLGGSVLVRRDHAEYPAAGGRPAVVHDGLMVVYPQGSALAAVYFDNEGHVIRYDVSPAAPGVVFLSEPVAGAPRYRLTYEPVARDEVMVTFEVAPPGEPPAFKTYVAGRSRRVAP
jgi:hypothetical protein